MKKFIVSTAFVASLALPAMAQQADTAADPFISTQDDTTTLIILAGAVTLVGVAALSGGDSSSSSTGSR